MSIPVVTVGETRADLVGGLERLHGPITVVRRCTELAELLAACQSGLAKAAVVADGSSELTATLVDRVAAVGVAMVALTEDGIEAERLKRLGVVTALPDADPAVLAMKISEAVAQLPGGHRGRPVAHEWGLADTGAEIRSEPAAVEASDGVRGTGMILAVWGPIGAPGRTFVAVNMAAELAAEGKSVLLVDADTYGASISGVVGLLDESAGLAQACRLADQGQLDAEALLRIAAPVFTKSGQLRVLTGITRASRWTEVRAPALATVLEKAREIADVVVVDAGFCLEADEELSFDTMAPRRNAATLCSLELADTVFAIGAADAIGLPRLVRSLDELSAAVPQASPRVLLNKVRQSAVGRSPEHQLRETWDRYGPKFAIEGFLPADFPACDASLLDGSFLLESAPDSALRHAIAKIVCASVQGNRKSSVFSTRAMMLLKR